MFINDVDCGMKVVMFVEAMFIILIHHSVVGFRVYLALNELCI